MKVLYSALCALALALTGANGKDNWEALIETAITQAKDGKMDDAVESVKGSLQEKDTHTGHHLLSQIYLAQGDNKNSLYEIGQALKLDPTNKALQADVKFGEAVEKHEAGDTRAAMDLVLESYTLQDKKSVREMEKTAIALAALGDIPKAAEALREVWKLEPYHTFHNELPMVKVIDLYDEMISLADVEGQKEAVDALNSQLSNITAVTDKIFFDISIGGGKSERVVLGLFRNAAPRGVHNLVSMASCVSEELCYKNNKLHRVIKNFIIQGGDVTNGDGSGVTNVYGRPFSDDLFGLTLMHNRAGVVQIANAGKNANGGQFVLMTGAAPHLNGNHVIAGHVLEGLDFVMEINDVSVDKDDQKPVKDVVITDCGVMK